MSAAANRCMRVGIMRELNRMMRTMSLLLLVVCFLMAPAAAQSVVRIVSFEKTDGIIDRGTEGGIRVGEIFEVNRYDGDFVYWVGRVEVVVVKSRFAGVKLLAKAENATIQKGDVLELQKPGFDPMLDKLKQSAANGTANGAMNGTMAKGTAEKTPKLEEMDAFTAMPGSRRPIQFGVASGMLLPVVSSSRLMGSSFIVNVQYPSSGRLVAINMSEAYATSLAFQAFFVLPLADRLSLNLNYAYAPLNVNQRKEAELLSNGLKASASLAQVTATAQWLWSNNLHFGVGAGLFLPQATVQSSRQSMTISDRQLGISLSATHQLALGAGLALRSQLAYNAFLNQGPVIHFLALQLGPSFVIGK